MKKITVIAGLAISSIATPAVANCPSGVCAMEINVTTGVVTYTDAPPRVATPTLVIPEPITPTHTVVIQTANSSFGTSGSLEQVTEAVQRIVTAPQAPQIDPCAAGGCTKIEVNATTGVTTILPLSPADIQQRLIDQYMNYARQLEMSIAARQAVIQPYVAPTSPQYVQPVIETATVESATQLIIDSTPVVYVTAGNDGKVNVVKKKPKALVRKKGKK
jgi:hypothetical protein